MNITTTTTRNVGLETQNALERFFRSHRWTHCDTCLQPLSEDDVKACEEYEAYEIEWDYTIDAMFGRTRSCIKCDLGIDGTLLEEAWSDWSNGILLDVLAGLEG